MPQIPAEYRVLEGSGRKPPTGAQRSSLADPGEVLTVSVRVRSRPDAPALPDPDNRVVTALHRLKYVSREDLPDSTARGHRIWISWRSLDVRTGST